MVQTRQQKKNQLNNLISATRLSNSVKNDKILDYLDLLDKNGLEVKNNLTIGRKRSYSNDYYSSDTIQEKSNVKKIKTSFDYIVENGYLFEYDIIDQIKQLMKDNNELNKLVEIKESDINLNCVLTIKTIKENKQSIILGSVLINPLDNTWGKPDLIVKGCWINKYIKEVVPGLDTNKWYIIDIKSSTIQLICGGEDISSTALFTGYKSQIYIYTQALNNLLIKNKVNNNVEMGFILGKKYKYVLNKNQIVKNSFDCVAIVDFEKEKNKGNDWSKITKSGIDWIVDLKTNWTNFTLNPINRDELYPNMKNPYNKNWFRVKKNIADYNKELSSIWYCGIANREKAWSLGIKSYMDENLTPEILGFDKRSFKYKIINSMLKLLHDTEHNYILNKKNNFMNWQNKARWEFFVDFETYNCEDKIYDEANEWDDIYNGSQKIYMCGISWIDIDNQTGIEKFMHKTFIINCDNIQELEKQFKINHLTYVDINWNDCVCCSNELELMSEIKNFINEFKPKNMTQKDFFSHTRLIHWSGAEPILFNKKIEEYKLDTSEYKLNWYDLLKVFKHPEYPIVIKECFGFGLKTVVRKLNEMGEITIVWPDLDDGLLSSFIAKDIYETEQNNNKSKLLNFNKEMYEIIQYNLIDCKAMWVLIDWMRKSVNK